MKSAQSKPKNSVLVVDDDEFAMEEMIEALSEFGLTVHKASTGDDALAQARRHRPDFVLMDYLLPGTTGLEVAASMRTRWPEIKVIMMSGAENFCKAATTRNTGAIAILRKPFPIDQVGEFICKSIKTQLEEADATDW